MGRYVWSQLRHRFGRTAALLLGIVVATTSFMVLTATSRTSQLRTTATVGENFRGAYDILVRPTGTQTAVEQRAGTVQPNFLAGIYGGITIEQWRGLQQVPGVDVAAPVAMVGTVLQLADLPVPIAPYLTGSPRQLFRVSTTWVSDRGTTRIPEPASFVYVTRNDLDARIGKAIGDDGATRGEVLPDGTTVPCCKIDIDRAGESDPFGPASRSHLTAFGANGVGFGEVTPPAASVFWSVPLLVAGVDPVSEARLAHLDGAVVSGRYLQPDDAETLPGVPVLVSQDSGVDSTVQVQVERMADPAGPLPLIDPAALPTTLNGPSVPVASTSFTSQQAYDQLLTGLSDGLQEVRAYWQSGPNDYTPAPAGALAPVERSNPPSTWIYNGSYGGVEPVSMDNDDTAYRTLAPHPWENGRNPARLTPVGVFDPGKLPPFDPLVDANLGLYTPVSAAPGDPAAQQVLGGRDLLPNGNLAGHLRQPPQLITTLAGITPLYGPTYEGTKPTAAPISVIRVRVAGVLGPDAVSVGRAALAVPAAVLLALLAGAVPAWRASRADPGAAVRPAVSTGRRSRSPHRVAGLALTNVLRTPGRSALAALSLAVGAAALTLLVGITLAFRGVVVGSLLGDAVAVQVRGVDYIAVIATVALGVLAVADVLFLNLRERASELATLRATGWTETALSRLVIVEGAVLGLTGALVGAAVGLAGAAVFAGALPGRLILVTALVLGGGTAVTALAALVPAQLLRRLPTAPLLAED